MKKIRITKIEIGEDNRFPPTSEGITMPGQFWDGIIEIDSFFPQIPTQGRPFVISTYRTSLVQQVLPNNIFKTMNSTYKWEEIK